MNIRARTVEDKQKRRLMLLKSAKELFFATGYYGTTINMITQKAGLSTGSFYVYYKNKIEIYKTLQEEGLDLLTGMIEKTLSWPAMNCTAKLSSLAMTYLRYYTEYREYFDILSVLSATPKELKETDSELSEIIRVKTLKLLKLIEDIIKHGIDSGEFLPLDTWKATNIFWGLMDGLILLAERNNIGTVIHIKLEELIKQSLEMTFFGILKNRP